MVHRSRSCLSALFGVVLVLVATAVAKAPPPSGTLSIATTSVTLRDGRGSP